MRISHYSFGKIVVDGTVYTSDLIVYPDRVDASWWRKEGHYLQKTDLSDVVAARPDLLVIGTGNLGVMQVPKETMEHLEAAGIQVIVEKTVKAVDRFNAEAPRKKTVGAFHLTC